MISHIQLLVSHKKPLPDLGEKVAGRAYTIDGVDDCAMKIEQAKTDKDISDAFGIAVIENLGLEALSGGKMSIYDAFSLGWSARSRV